jgi:hypothetical protein
MVGYIILPIVFPEPPNFITSVTVSQRFYMLDTLPEKIIIGHRFFIDQRHQFADCSC